MAAQETRNYDVNSDTILRELRSARFCRTLNIELKDEKALPNGVWLRYYHGATIFSLAETITVAVVCLEESKTQVTIQSEYELSKQVVDFGKNKKNVNNMFECLERNAGVVGTLNAAAVQIPVVEEKITVETVIEKIVCRNCGAELQGSAVFCTACGAKLELEIKPTDNICPNCNSKEKDNAVFCSQCGTKMK